MLHSVPCHKPGRAYGQMPAPGSRKNLSLDEFFSRIYLPHARISKRSWQLDERLARRHLSGLFGARALGGISGAEIEACLGAMRESGYAATTCNRILAVLKSVFSFAEKRGFLPLGHSPCRHISPFKASCQKARYLSREEARKLMEALKKDGCRSALALQLLLLTGARKNEILKARWENIDLAHRCMTVPLSKSGYPRHIVLSEAAMAIIRKIPRLPDNPWLFAAPASGRPLSDLYDYWQRLRSRLGLEGVRIHDLRHTYASFLVNSGHSLYEVQKMLGHSDPRTTMRYAHLERASLVAASEEVSAIFVMRG